MNEIKKLGFGLMRLPVIGGNAENIDLEQVCQMVDLFLDRGFTYFDTAWAYHNGKSEEAVREALVKRHPRESFLLASKLPTFAITSREQVQEMFQQSLERTGAGYFDYYLLHNLNNILYDGIVREFGMFETMQEWKADGKIRHIGFSFHDEAETLERMLSDHPEVDFVQICVNYLDWEHWSVQARKCYEVIRKHGKQVVVMEAVKGGTLVSLPSDVDALLKEKNPNRSPVDWSLPEVDFVQICVNYLDWEHWSVQARKCYEVIRKHGKQVVVMEAVKGGTLVSLPSDVDALLKEKNPNRSPVDWSLYFGASLDGVIAALSGMSTLEQVEQNTKAMQDFQPLDAGEQAVLAKAAAMMDSGMKYPLTDGEAQKNICPKGIRAAELIQYYNEAIQEVNPAFSSELNYYRLLKARSAPVSACDKCGKCAGLFPSEDVPRILKEAESFFEKYGFFL